MARIAGAVLAILLVIAACTPSDPRLDDSDVFGPTPTPQGVTPSALVAAPR